MENYPEYHLMGTVSQIRLRAGCVPRKFACQPDRKRRTEDITTRPLAVKRQRLESIAECEREIEQTHSTQSISVAEVQPGPSSDMLPPVLCSPITTDKSIQVSLSHKFRSKSTQTTTKFRNIALSPMKNLSKSISTSPLKQKNYRMALPSSSSAVKISKKLCFGSEVEQYDSDVSSLFTPSVTHSSSSSSLISQEIKLSSENSSLNEYSENSSINKQIIKQEEEEIVQMTIKKVKKRPRFYIGVPKNCYYLINIISKHTNIPEKYILLCLKKIRLDTKFSELADEFGMSVSYACKIFLKNIPIICSVMSPFIVNLETNSIKQCLPMAFRHKYHNVSCIIDCLEIEIQKPSNAVNQALTWSDYKKANTLKYLISSTPDGLVNYISPGYGGRTSDVCVVETCNFLNTLEKGSCILADRGFKHIEQMVLQASLHLVRPPSVSTGSKLSKEEARQTKQIASLRIHIERVIRRLREFAMLKPHACINNYLIKILDEVIIIACALINLQDSVIK
ncbi:uncharacterized protein LOC106136451 isoform X2 [Amyelois transitella]|nr:uncharacterized protein LOC106136451 isoform X2 [Amyelois transitella]XP_060804274.1 uncharacterized protein LOC106136451 isoform X2 [Amyelois transitella]XP_060804275.1 uncharacterized protein LOC106136451 isoform X2 [Amyelois transitella]